VEQGQNGLKNHRDLPLLTPHHGHALGRYELLLLIQNTHTNGAPFLVILPHSDR
jgi:hypothetical protein